MQLLYSTIFVIISGLSAWMADRSDNGLEFWFGMLSFATFAGFIILAITYFIERYEKTRS